MHRPAIGVTLTLLALLSGGCSFVNERTSSAANTDVDTNKSPTPAAPTATETFDNPAQSAKPEPSTLALTSPTNPDERRLVIKTGRADPFKSLLPEPPPESSTARSTRRRSGGGSAQATQARRDRVLKTFVDALKNNTAQPQAKKAASKSQPRPATSPSASPSPAGEPTAKIKLPPLPKAEVAKGIKVQGILTLGEPQAIILAPDEKTPRTVRVGQRLSNNRVLVKRFDLSNPNAPLIIFEEAGTQVAAGVGRDAYIIATAPPTVSLASE